MDLGQADRFVGQLDSRPTLQLPPSTRTVHFPQSLDLANGRADRDGLNFGNTTNKSNELTHLIFDYYIPRTARKQSLAMNADMDLVDAAGLVNDPHVPALLRFSGSGRSVFSTHNPNASVGWSVAVA